LKKVVAILMIVLVSATTLVSIYLQVTKQVAKFMALEKLEKTQLIKIKVEKNKIHWVEKEYELRINSELFDVKSYTTLSNGDIICMGLFDSAEDEVIESTAKIFDHKNSATTHSLVIKICSLVFDKQHTNNDVAFIEDMANKRYPQYQAYLQYITTATTAPPPKC
jgi:hypothetical protein